MTDSRTTTLPLHPLRLLAALIGLAALAGFAPPTQAAACPELLTHRFASLQGGEPHDLCQYRGKVVLVVNTASYCAFTDQYGGLESLYRRYKDRGLVVLGFPSNDFGNQEPDGNAKIADFCRLTYSVEFPMFEKSRVVGAPRNPLFAELEARTGVAPRWNFHKYLIDATGRRIVSFESGIPPDHPSLVRELKRMLDARAIAKPVASVSRKETP